MFSPYLWKTGGLTWEEKSISARDVMAHRVYTRVWIRNKYIKSLTVVLFSTDRQYVQIL
jgi:uncharacterized protein (DUF4213/DUF364 family)